MHITLKSAGILSCCAALAASIAFAAQSAAGTADATHQDRSTLKVPGGMAFA